MNLSEQQLKNMGVLYRTTGIPFSVLSTKGLIVASFPDTLHEFYKTDYWLFSQRPMKGNKHPDGVTLFEVGEMCYVAIVKLSTELYLSTVPVRASAQVAGNLLPSLKNGIVAEKQVEFHRFLLDLPVKTNFELAEIASLAKVAFCGKTAEGINLRFLEEETRHIDTEKHTESVSLELSYQEAVQENHLTMEHEQQLLQAITAGDETALAASLARPLYNQIGRMSLNDLRQAKYEFICMMYAGSRAAIQGGLPAEYSFQLSDAFCQKMDDLQSVSDILHHRNTCLMEYARQVARYKGAGHYSSYTTACLDYISRHLFEPLDLELLSQKIGLNRRSLNEYFKADIGETLAKYILRKRLEEAAFLLMNTGLDISAIAELLHFSSQSHFTEKFRQQYGVTPLKYRLNHGGMETNHPERA